MHIRHFSYEISDQHQNVTVENYLMKTHGYSRRIITKLKKEPGHILLNGVHVRMVDRLQTGDTLAVTLMEESHLSPNPDLYAEIVYEDDDLILFNKPSRMPVHPSVGHHDDTLGNYYSWYLGQKGENVLFRPINRLDADTTGLCLVAKNALSANHLAGHVDKEYTAILCGELPDDMGEINEPIARCPDSLIKRMVSPDGQPSCTRYRVETRINGYTLVRVTLLTGRTHQIRVHFSHMGYPLAGDSLYGGDCRHINRHALCCTKMNFMHPIMNKTLNFCINIQNDMQDILKQVHKNSL